MLRINNTMMEFSLWLAEVHMQQVQYIACIDLASKQFYQCFIFESHERKQKWVINL